MKIIKFFFLVISLGLVLFSSAIQAQNVDLSVTEIWPAVKGQVPDYDFNDQLRPYYGGYYHIPAHVFQGYDPIGLPVMHPGEDNIDFDWQLTLTADPDGSANIVFDQTNSFSLSAGEADTIVFGQGITYNQKNDYELSATLSSPNDNNNSNNQATFRYALSDSVYGFADKDNISGSFTLVDTLNAGNQDGVGIVTYFPEPVEDPYQINSMSTFLKDDYTGVIDNGNATLVGVIYPRNETTGQWNLSSAVAQTNPKNLDIDDVNSLLTMPFTSPLQIDTEKEYLLLLYFFNNDDATDNGRITIGNDPVSFAPTDMRCVMVINGSIEYAQGTPAIWANIEPQSLPASSEAEILSYSIPGQNSSNIDPDAQTIEVSMPHGTDVTALVADFTLSAGATATVGGTEQISGTTQNDFSSDLVYTVTAEDGTTTKNWTVTVNVALSDEAEILSYNIPNQINSTINDIDQTIDVTMPQGTDLTNLVADFTLSPGATATVEGNDQISGTTANNFSSPVVYIVTAEDGVTTKAWTVTVENVSSTDTDILSYSIPGQESSIIDDQELTVDVIMPPGTDLTNLVADFTLSPGATATVDGVEQISGTTSNDFTSTVIYTVTADDGITAVDWSVNVSINASSEADILTYSLPGQISSTIDSDAQTVDVEIPLGTDLTDLVAEFTLSTGATAIVGGTEQISGTTSNDFTDPVVYTVTAQDGSTSKDWTVSVTTVASSETDILTYSIPGQISSDIDDAAQTVDVIMPMDTDLSALVAEFTLSTGATATVGGEVQESGVTINNFADPVIYTITAQDGTTTSDWTINVTNQTLSPTDFISFSIDGQQGSIDYTNRYIRIIMPEGTDLTNLVADFEVADGTNVTVEGAAQESGVTINDFTDIVEYRLIPASGPSKTWYVDVAEEDNMNSGTAISYFGFYGQTNPATINSQNHTISVNLEPQLDVTALIPMFYLSDGAIAYIESTIQWSGQNIVDFSSTVTYTIVAENGTNTQDWTVEVTTNQNSAAQILDYSFDGIPLADQQTTIYNSSGNIYVDVPQGTPRDGLIANFQLSSGATASVGGTVQESGITANDFTNPVSYVVTAQNGSNQRNWTVNVRYFTGIDERGEAAFTMYPNPATNVVNVEVLGDNSGLLVISDQLGRVQNVIRLNNMITQINLESLDAGIYFITFRKDQKQWTKRLIVN